MASGTLGQSALSANSNTVVYIVPAGVTSTFNINCLNANNLFTVVRIAIANNSTPSLSEYIEYGTSLGPFSTLERTGIVASAGKNIVVHSTVGDLSVNIYGFED